MRRFRRMTVICLVLVIALAYAFSCSKPTKPEEPRGLRLYVVDNQTTNLYAIDPEADSVLDSLPNMVLADMVLSRDGSWLYATAFDYIDHHILKINTRILEITDRFDGAAGSLTFLDNERILMRSLLDSVQFIDPQTFELNRVDRIELLPGASRDTLDFVVGYSRDLGMVVYDYIHGGVIAGNRENFAGPNHVSIHPSGHEGYAVMTGTGGWFVAFSVPDLVEKFRFGLNSSNGECAPSPDGRLVLVSDPGRLPVGPPVGDLLIYDVAAGEITQRISTDTLTMLDPLYAGAISQIEYSPDGSTAFISTGCGGFAAGPVLIFDMERLAFVGQVVMPHEGLRIGKIAVGYMPSQ